MAPSPIAHEWPCVFGSGIFIADHMQIRYNRVMKLAGFQFVICTTLDDEVESRAGGGGECRGGADAELVRGAMAISGRPEGATGCIPVQSPREVVRSCDRVATKPRANEPGVERFCAAVAAAGFGSDRVERSGAGSRRSARPSVGSVWRLLGDVHCGSREQPAQRRVAAAAWRPRSGVER